jgi:DNA-binding transcriptional regulator YdaS (Cro superfamily)
MATECAGAPPARATVYSRTLQRACEILGGVEPLAQHLRVSPTQLAHWIDGRGQPPMEVFLAAVDIVLRTV